MSRSHLSIIAVALLLGTGSGCSDREASAPTVVTRDSAGVEIVDNHVAIEALPEWRLSAEPSLRIGALEGDPSYQLFGVADALRLPDRGLAVVNAGTHEVRVFDPEGRFRLSFGSEGEGPEEFTVPVAVWPLPGDSLLVYDYQGQRFSAWTREGEFGRVSPLMPKFLNPPRVRGRLADGSLVFSDVYFDIPGTGFDWVPLVVQAYGVDGVLRDTLREYPGRKFGRLVNAGLVGSPLFYRRTVVFAGERGLFAGRGERREIEVSNAAGELTHLIRWTGPPLEVTDAAISRYRDEALRIFRIEGGELLGAETDELDVEYVVAYDIAKGP